VAPDGLRSQTLLFRALHEVSVTASRGFEPAELVRVVVERAAELLGADAVSLYLWDEATSALVQMYTNDVLATAPDPPMSSGTGAAGLAFERREPVRIDDYQAWELATPWGLERGVRSAEAVPLIVADQAIGVLGARFYRQRALTSQDVEWLMLLGAQAAPALEFARLYARSQWQHERQRALREMAQVLARDLDERRVLDLAVQHAASLLAAPYARVWLLDSEGRLSPGAAEGHVQASAAERLRDPDTLAALAAQIGVVNVPDAPSHPAWRDRQFAQRTGLRAYLGARLWRAGASLGTLEVMRPAGGTFTEAEAELLAGLATAVAFALGNAWAHAAAEGMARQAEIRARAEERAGQRRLAFLAEASQILASSLEYETTLQGVARLAVPSLADACFVDMLEQDGTTRRVASAWRDGSSSADRELLGWSEPTSLPLDDGSPTARSLRSGAAVFLPTVASVPLVARTGVVGAITCLTREDRLLTPADVELAGDLARRCAMAIDNAHLYREAREAIGVRDEFLSVAAHELRTPLTSLRGYAQLLVRDFERKGAVDPERGRRSATTIMLQADKLSRLVDQLLNVSAIQFGKLVIERRPTDLSRLVRDAAEAIGTQLRGRRLAVHAPAELLAMVDPLRLEQVVANLLDNAVRYSDEGGLIEVALSVADEGTAALTVRDYGPGITREDRRHIFDRFYQGRGRGALTDQAGMGLGLFISREIVRLHGGRVAAEFPPDGGARFVVSLPLGDPVAPSGTLPEA